MKCSFCNTPLPPDASFCPGCGTHVMIVYCPQCQAQNLSGDAFCRNCGTKIPVDKQSSVAQPQRDRQLNFEKTEYQNNEDKKKRNKWLKICCIGVICVIIFLIDLFIESYFDSLEQLRKDKVPTAWVQLQLLDEAVQQYKLDVGTYPSNLQGLMENIDLSEKWDGPYIKPKVPLDPWGREYYYLFPGDHGEFDLYSLGADGMEGGTGENADITNWDLYEYE